MATEPKQLKDMSDDELRQYYRSGVGYADNKSVLDASETSFKDIATNTLESISKGSAKGILDLVGGWEALYNYLDAGKDASAFKPTRILGAVKNLTGVDLENAPYRTPYNISAAGAPAALSTMVGVPGLFTVPQAASTAQRLIPAAKEFGVAGTVGAAAPFVTESGLGQVAIGMSPYLVKGGYTTLQSSAMRPQGAFPPVAETRGLLSVGPMTPGELTGSRQQLATEARVAASPRAQEVLPFRQEQAASVENYLDNLFTRASSKAVDSDTLTTSVVNSFKNYGKSLSTTLRSDAAKDFRAAKAAGGKVDTSPIIATVQQRLAGISPETPGFEGLRSSLSRIIEEYAIPAIPEKTTASAIVSESGQPVATTVTPGTPAQALSIDIDRLQKNLSAWGEAAYSGKADFGKGNIFEGVAPGQAKGIALDVLKGFRTSLDNAIADGVPGADKLKIARDRFSANIDKISEFSDRPLTRVFDVDSPSQLVPEKEAVRLKNLPPSQRAVLIEVMGNTPEGAAALDTIRRMKFNEVLSKGEATGAAQNAPEFNIDVALKELNKKDGEFGFLFQQTSDLNDARLVTNYMKRVLQSETGGAAAGMAGSTAYATTKALGGNTQLANASKELTDVLRDKITNPEVFSRILFDTNSKDALIALAKGKTTLEKVNSAITAIGKVGGITAVRGGPMLSPEYAPGEAVNAPNVPAGVEGLSDEELRRLYNE
jgi:hypothetical protein